MSKKLLIIGGTGIFGKCFTDSFIRKKLSKKKITKLVILSRNPKEILKYFKKGEIISN
jgi:FlaA1/EpsC-like NDP-sugar epimerase